MENTYNIDLKPDKDIEDFWMTFKCCISNFYKSFDIEDDIENISNKLNNYQKYKQYSLIEYTIHQTMFKIISHVCENINILLSDKFSYIYHIRIILTNLKRWENLRNDKIFFKEPIHNENMFYILIDCLRLALNNISKDKFTNETIDVFSEFQDIINNNNIIMLIDYGITIKCAGILDILSKKYNIVNYINNKYNLKLHPSISGRKILKKLN